MKGEMGYGKDAGEDEESEKIRRVYAKEPSNVKAAPITR
jgi:hypothetical protein